MGFVAFQADVSDSSSVMLTQVDNDYRMGQDIRIDSTGPLYFGPADVTNSGTSRGALLSAGTHIFDDCNNDDELAVIAPQGQTVHIEVLVKGVGAKG